jgi:hypothetical protein
MRSDPYRLKRKVMKTVTDRMRTDGSLGPAVGLNLSGGLDIYQVVRGDVRILHLAWASCHPPPPFLQSQLKIVYLDQYALQLGVQPHKVFLDPDLGDIGSGEEAERVIRQM